MAWFVNAGTDAREVEPSGVGMQEQGERCTFRG